ncbi:MAG: ABC transporter permease [Nanoarchaeota archaeon]|nr:ABC transporter permease [Nanoarchaeota archaeon]
MGIKFHRINALLIRHLYLYKRSVPRLMDIMFWPVMTLILWGFISKYLEHSNLSGLNIITVLLGAVILWEILSESQHSLSVAFLEEVWEKNLINIFVTPLKLSEFVISTALLGFVRVFLVTIMLSTIAFFSYTFNIFDLGFYIIPFAINLLLFGWILGLFIVAIILRFGTSAQILAFGIMFLIQPFTAVFYPVSILPTFARYISLALPSTHVFEGMRAVIATGEFSINLFLIGLGLNIIYLILALWFFYRMFAHIKNQGKLMKLD